MKFVDMNEQNMGMEQLKNRYPMTHEADASLKKDHYIFCLNAVDTIMLEKFASAQQNFQTW